MAVGGTTEWIARRFLDRVLSGESPDDVDELVSADVLDHDALPGHSAGREGLRRLAQTVGRAFGRLDVEVGELISHGDRVVARWSARPHGAAGESVDGIDIFRVVDGRIVERRSQSTLAAALDRVAEAPAGGRPSRGADEAFIATLAAAASDEEAEALPVEAADATRPPRMGPAAWSRPTRAR